MNKTPLQKYAEIAKTRGCKFMSKEEEHRNCLLWCNERDEAALERLFIDKALLVIKKTRGLKMAFSDIVSLSDIDAWALEGIKQGAEIYIAKNAEYSLNTYVGKCAHGNVFTNLRKYRAQNTTNQDKAFRALREAVQEKQGELTTAEEEKILGSISPSLKRTFYMRKTQNTITSGALKNTMWQQHPSTDDQPRLQNEFNDHMDAFPDKITLSPDDALEREIKSQMIRDALETLTKREKKYLQLRFGIGVVDLFSVADSRNTGCYMTLEQIGDLWGVTPERVRQVEAKALRKLRHPSIRRYLVDCVEAEEENNKSSKDLNFTMIEDEAFDRFLELAAE